MDNSTINPATHVATTASGSYLTTNSIQNVSVDLEVLMELLLAANKSGLLSRDMSGDAMDADDAIWILTSTFIIFTMQSGFGLLESGSVSTKNEVNIMVKNSVDVVFGGITYWLFGYAFSFGEEKPYSNGFNGWGNFMALTPGKDMGKVYAKFFFQSSFATTATTIVSGAMAERTRLESYIVFSALNTLVFVFPAHWVWARSGWLYQMGMVDIAGDGPVHLVGGVTGLVATMILKPRHKRYENKDPPPMGSPTNVMLGAFMLWWGWLGFNCGSTFGVSGTKWKLAAKSAIATLVASLGGGVFGVVVSYIFKKRKFDIGYMVNSLLGSLVGITAYCALAEPWESFVIGVVGSMVTLSGIELINRLRIDDPVGCVGVHGFGALWGLIAVGLFYKNDPINDALGLHTDMTGLFYGGGVKLLGVQLLGFLVITAWTAVTSFLLLTTINMFVPLRMTLEEEILGADIVEHGLGSVRYDKRPWARQDAGTSKGTMGDIRSVVNDWVRVKNGSHHGAYGARRKPDQENNVSSLFQSLPFVTAQNIAIAAPDTTESSEIKRTASKNAKSRQKFRSLARMAVNNKSFRKRLSNGTPCSGAEEVKSVSNSRVDLKALSASCDGMAESQEDEISRYNTSYASMFSQPIDFAYTNGGFSLNVNSRNITQCVDL